MSNFKISFLQLIYDVYPALKPFSLQPSRMRNSELKLLEITAHDL